MTKRKSTRKKGADQSRVLLIISLIVIILLSLIAASGVGYYFGFSDGRDDMIERFAKAESMQKRYEVVATKPPVPVLIKRPDRPVKRVTEKTASHEYSTPLNKVDRPPSGPIRPNKLTVDLPKLAIIIDDVAFRHDVKKIKALDLPLTMSFLPPSANHPDSAALAAREPFYMVHLPLEARHFATPEPSTLRTRDSQEKILEHIRELKQLFPKVRYVNNHTGSTFTSDEIAMNRLIFALGKENIGFIDSRTTGKTVVPYVMKNFGLSYVARDIFLDHDSDISTIKRQIAKAVGVARKHGSAIAIGHPRRETMEALRQSQRVLSKVELVRIDELL